MSESRDTRLAGERLARCLGAMRDHAVDALLLSRAANMRYACGARRIYSSGTRPFAPTCLVTAPGDVHVLGVGDAGVPAHVAAGNRHAARWHADDVAATVTRILGGGRKRIGVDGMSVGQRAVLQSAMPDVEWVDGDAVMRGARAVKTATELEALAEADRIAGVVGDLLAGEFEPGMTPTGLRARAAGAVAGAGAVLAASPRVETGPGGLRAEIAVLVDGYAGEAVVVAPGQRAAEAGA